MRGDFLQAHRDLLLAFLKGYTVSTGYTYNRVDWAKQSFQTYLQRDDPVFLQGVFDSYVRYPSRDGGMPLDPTPTLALMKRQIGLQARLDTTVDPDKMDPATIVDATLMEDVKASNAWAEAWPSGVPQE